MENPVRFAAPIDVPALLRLLVQVNMVHHNGRPDLFRGPATKYGEADLLTMLADPDRPVFVCEDSRGEVLGYAMCVLRSHPDDPILTDIRTLYIDDICVDEAARGKQIGRRLFDRAVAFAREKECHNVTLNVWSCNPSAQGFYEHLGMKPQKIGMELLL